MIITVHKNAVVVAKVMSWKNHNTVGFWSDFLIHNTLYIFKPHCQLSKQSVLMFIQTSDKDVSQWPLSSSTPGQHNVCQLDVYIRLLGQFTHIQFSSGYSQQNVRHQDW
jgi:hypothetical protein